MIAGVDGTKAGWIAAIDRGDGRVCIEPFQEFARFATRKDIRLIVIDVPIGLLERGTREADEEARALLKNRACCVFTAPIRPILSCESREEASDKWQAIEGKRCTKQLWGIIHKVREVDEALRKTPGLRKKVYEGHPEVSFAVACGGRAI